MTAMNINRQEFEKLIAGDMPVLAEFWANWCMYCRRIGPAFDHIADKYHQQLIAVKLNIDDEPELHNELQIEVVPTLILYHRGKELGSIVAPDSGAMIEEFIRETLAKEGL